MDAASAIRHRLSRYSLMTKSQVMALPRRYKRTPTIKDVATSSAGFSRAGSRRASHRQPSKGQKSLSDQVIQAAIKPPGPPDSSSTPPETVSCSGSRARNAGLRLPGDVACPGNNQTGRFARIRVVEITHQILLEQTEPKAAGAGFIPQARRNIQHQETKRLIHSRS